MDDFAGMEGLFEQMFDAAPGRGARDVDLSLAVSISLAEAFEGCERAITVSRREVCAACEGRRCAAGVDAAACEACAGAGRRSVEQGAFRIDTSCAECGGRGFPADALCAPCDGVGSTTAEAELKVQIPGGVRDGHQLRLRGAGDRTTEEPGDVYVSVEITPDRRFARVDDDVCVVVELSAEELAAGGVFEVPHWAEDCRIELEPGTTAGAERVLDGWGPVRLGAARVAIPTSHDDPYRSVDVSAHRGNLIVQLRLPVSEPDVAPWAPPPTKHGRGGELLVFVMAALLFAFIAWQLLDS